MLDIKFIRENPDKVRDGAASKNIEVPIEEILRLDEEYRELSRTLQELYTQRNRAAKERDVEGGREIKAEVGSQESKLREVEEKLNTLLRSIPNLPLNGVPVGDESKFDLIKKSGSIKTHMFKVRDHLELGEILDIIDVERAGKVSGTRFGYLKNEGVLLELALVQFAIETLMKEGFSPVIPPSLIKFDITQELGYWNAGNHNNYYLVSDYEELDGGKEQENLLYLIGTGEHVIVPMHKNETLLSKNLPVKYAAFSPCYRREAGSYGRDTRGILRVHQFDKVEMVEFVKPEDDETERRKMLSLAEKLMQALELPYQVVKLATSDLAFPSAETIDIETWIPSQNKYRETHSISTTTDFQARRLNIKYQEGSDKKFVHILNGTAFAIGRTLIAMLENYQQEDGSVMMPEVLRNYINIDKILPKILK
ncbi:MAG: serine--tRNA ligase [Candidatus Levybacteria bacterium]|nr:serine--tRNA ligase [Candidatus Levybacteria bacterium]